MRSSSRTHLTGSRRADANGEPAAVEGNSNPPCIDDDDDDDVVVVVGSLGLGHNHDGSCSNFVDNDNIILVSEVRYVRE